MIMVNLLFPAHYSSSRRQLFSKSRNGTRSHTISDTAHFEYKMCVWKAHTMLFSSNLLNKLSSLLAKKGLLLTLGHDQDLINVGIVRTYIKAKSGH